MTDRLIRLMRIITLVQSRPGILARELAERCGTSERTIYRDMEALSAMHIPIAHQGHGKGYAFIGNFALHPLDWSDEEAVAFAEAGTLLGQWKGLLPEAFESAYDKVLAWAYKQRADKEEKLESVKKEGGPGRMERSYQTEVPPFLSAVLAAVLKRKAIKADYCENSYQEEGTLIHPYGIVPLENRFYLIGYCHRLRQIRTFNLSSISRVTLLDASFSKERFDMQQFLQQKWSLDRDSLLVKFKVRFSEQALYEMTGHVDMPIRPLKSDPDARCLFFEVSLEQDSRFMRWIAGFGEDAEILEPLYYRDALRFLLERWLAVYSR